MNDEILKHGFYFTKTLLGCEPGYDTNRRTLYWGHAVLGTMEPQSGKYWETWRDESLQLACDELNKVLSIVILPRV